MPKELRRRLRRYYEKQQGNQKIGDEKKLVMECAI